MSGDKIAILLILTSLLVTLLYGVYREFVLMPRREKKNHEARQNCDHVFFPVRAEGSNMLIGQRCALCETFNHVDSVIPGYTERWMKENNEQV